VWVLDFKDFFLAVEDVILVVQSVAALLGKYERNRKKLITQLKIIRFYHFKKNMKAMVII
jgi:hypothetical protein